MTDEEVFGVMAYSAFVFIVGFVLGMLMVV